MAVPDRRRLVGRNLRRARGVSDPTAIRASFESYARYWVESFRLPSRSLAQLDEGLSYEGFEHILDARASGKGVICVLPHLGGWEWAAFWLTRIGGVPITAVVEALEPPELFDWFVELRSALGMTVVAAGPHAGPTALRALRAREVLCLVADRDLAGDGVEVEFFGERTTLPAGPAVLALRSGAPLVPTAVYFRPDDRLCVLEAPIEVGREGSLREDIDRITRLLARRLEALVRRAPDQWHLQQPNWPSDTAWDGEIREHFPIGARAT